MGFMYIEGKGNPKVAFFLQGLIQISSAALGSGLVHLGK